MPFDLELFLNNMVEDEIIEHKVSEKAAFEFNS